MESDFKVLVCRYASMPRILGIRQIEIISLDKGDPKFHTGSLQCNCEEKCQYVIWMKKDEVGLFIRRYGKLIL